VLCHGQPAAYCAQPCEHVAFIGCHDNKTMFDQIIEKAATKVRAGCLLLPPVNAGSSSCMDVGTVLGWNGPWPISTQGTTGQAGCPVPHAPCPAQITVVDDERAAAAPSV
jgi:hypothetical protein